MALDSKASRRACAFTFWGSTSSSSSSRSRGNRQLFQRRIHISIYRGLGNWKLALCSSSLGYSFNRRNDYGQNVGNTVSYHKCVSSKSVLCDNRIGCFGLSRGPVKERRVRNIIRVSASHRTAVLCLFVFLITVYLSW